MLKTSSVRRRYSALFLALLLLALALPLPGPATSQAAPVPTDPSAVLGRFYTLCTEAGLPVTGNAEPYAWGTEIYSHVKGVDFYV